MGLKQSRPRTGTCRRQPPRTHTSTCVCAHGLSGGRTGEDAARRSTAGGLWVVPASCFRRHWASTVSRLAQRGSGVQRAVRMVIQDRSVGDRCGCLRPGLCATAPGRRAGAPPLWQLARSFPVTGPHSTGLVADEVIATGALQACWGDYLFGLVSVATC